MNKTRGFTVTELMIVVVIVAALALLAFWAVKNQINKALDARRKGDIAKIKIAVEEYEKDHDCYPLPGQVVCDPGTGLRPYMDKIPCDPRTGASYYYDHEDSECPGWFRFYTTLYGDNMGQLGPNNSYNFYSGSPNAPFPSSSSGFYGCFSGVCTAITWDPARPGPRCDPNYGSATCYGQCTDPGTGAPINECTDWNK